MLEEAAVAVRSAIAPVAEEAWSEGESVAGRVLPWSRAAMEEAGEKGAGAAGGGKIAGEAAEGGGPAEGRGDTTTKEGCCRGADEGGN